MNKELMRSVSESLLKLRFLVISQFLKPMRERERERCEFSPGHLHVLGLLKSKGEPFSMTDLASASFISKPNLTTMVDRLCSDGLVERLADVADRRIVNVALTDKGNDYMNRHKAEFGAFIEGKLALLDDRDLEKLRQILDDLADIVQIIRDKDKNIK
jgi:Transcriptional regulators